MLAIPTRYLVIISGVMFLMALGGRLGLSHSVAACQTRSRANANQSRIVFQVGDFVMTAKDLDRFAIDHMGGPLSSQESKVGLVNSLVRSKIFSLAARAARLDTAEDFLKARETARDKVLAISYIERRIQDQYSEEAAQAYFETHKDEFKYYDLQRWEIIARLRRQAVAGATQSLVGRWKVKFLEDLKTLNLRSADPTLVLAQVEDLTVTAGDLVDLAGQRFERPDLSRVPVEEQVDLLNWLVLNRLGLLEAKKTGLDHDPEVQKELSWAEDELLAARYIAMTQGKVGLEQARRYHEAHPEEFKRPDQIWLRQILVATPVEASAVKAKLASGQSFEEVAKSDSADRETAPTGGDMGWVRKGRLFPEVEKEVFQLKPKQVSEPIKTSDGYIIVKVEERLVGAMKPFDEMASQILLQLKRQALEAEGERLMAVYKVTINKELL